MPDLTSNPRILIVTPEVTYLPKGLGNFSNYLTAKAGGLADVSAALISSLFEQGADVHVALPDYRTIFTDQLPELIKNDLFRIRSRMPDDRIHLAEDRSFFYMHHVYSSYDGENIKMALAFQREVINNIIPQVKPHLIHCNDWMTGLIPSMSRQMGIPCLFTLHNIFTMKTTLEVIEDRGIDAAAFWKNLFYEHMPYNYEESRVSNPVDFLCSGIFASHFVNTVSPTFLKEVVEGRHGFIEPHIRQELVNKWNAGCAAGILNAPDPTFNPAEDKKMLVATYTPATHAQGKKANKCYLQEILGLHVNPDTPLFFWPSRLDTVQKGCQLLAKILYETIVRYRDRGIQLVFVANGEFQHHFREILHTHRLYDQVAVCNFNERLSHIGYAAADFLLMPSRFEPCGLPQMIGPIYGCLPVAHDTGGIHDTIVHLQVDRNQGNGFLFEHFDANGLSWGIDQAMAFFDLPLKARTKQIRRIMQESLATFNHSVTARLYMDLYERMLKRPLIS